jgi:hypothetical protein
MARVTGYAFDGVTLAVAHVRNIHQRHGIVSQRDDPAAGREFGQRLPCQHGGQRAFEAAQVQGIVHRERV